MKKQECKHWVHAQSSGEAGMECRGVSTARGRRAAPALGEAQRGAPMPGASGEAGDLTAYASSVSVPSSAWTGTASTSPSSDPRL